MNLVQQLAEYQNAPLQTLEAAKQGANPAISPWVAGAILSDRIEKQKRMQNMQGAAQGPQPTVSEQQDQEVSGIMSLQGAPQMPAAPQGAAQPPAQPPQEGPGMASGGIISSRMDPRMFDFSGGGIIAFSGEEQSDVPKADPTSYLNTVQEALINSPEWADLEKARTAQYEAPKLSQAPADVAAERAAHLKAQGIEKAPWQTAAEQTAALRKILGDEDAARAKDRADNEREERYRTFVANLGAGSFGQSAQGGLRANLKREAEQKAEDQRIKELRYNQNLKLNEIDAKAKELQYNEAVGDVAAAQKNREELVRLKRDADKDRAAIAEKQATLRERAVASGLQSETSRANTAEMAATRRQTAAQAKQARQDAQADKIEAGHRDLAMKLAMAAAQKDMALPQNYAKYQGVSAEEVAAQMFPRILKGLVEGKISSGTGPASISESDQALINKYAPKK